VGVGGEGGGWGGGGVEPHSTDKDNKASVFAVKYYVMSLVNVFCTQCTRGLVKILWNTRC